MSLRIKRVAAAVVATAGFVGGAVVATAPAAHAETTVMRICPYPYYGVEVYDPYGTTIAYACVHRP
jgi:hypothetical protein